MSQSNSLCLLFLCMNRLKNGWIVSLKSLTWSESIQGIYESTHDWIVSIILESYHKSLWLSLNRFTPTLNRFNFFWAVWIVSFFTWHSFIESTHVVDFVRKFTLVHLFYKYSLPHNFQFIETFATILSRSQKLIVHTFFKIKHFFLESLCSLSL